MTDDRLSDGRPKQSRDNLPLEAVVRRMMKVSTNTPVRLTELPGGVSSDIFRAEIGERTLCVKRALPKLKVAADWRAPVERNRYEVEWMRVAGSIVPAAVPPLLGVDDDAQAFAMAYLPPHEYPVWKALLQQGRIGSPTAASVGTVLGRIHAATADRGDVASRFPTDAIFHAIRLEPYLVATARAHPDLVARLSDLVDVTAGTRRVLVHGDFSPKNILIGRRGPVVLDAECACFGDPAFDLAFVLNHLLLKGAWRPAWCEAYLDAYFALRDAYRAHVDWERWEALEARTAALLAGLLLARVDGKSPVEYLDTAARDHVRRFARELVLEPPPSLLAFGKRWKEATATP